MNKFTAQVISVHSGSNRDSSKDAHAGIQAELDGIVGDAHRSYERKAWAGGDKQPEGKVLKFPSGAELVVVEYNPPCGYMGEKVASLYSTKSGAALSNTAFSKAAKLTRGIVGVVDVAGVINAGDDVTVEIYETPSWLVRSDTL